MADEFLTTRWSVIVRARGNDGGASGAMEQLCRDVWRPLYAFARRWGCQPEDAEDMVQGFIASLLARNSLANVEAGRGRFRSFLLAGMRNHLSDEKSRSRAQKRGGGAGHISLDTAAEEGYAALAVDAESPERAFERVWAMEMMARTREKLRGECAASGKADLFAVLFPEDAETGGFAGAAERLGLSETALRSAAMRLRRRWRELIRAELAQTVTSGEALDDEMRALQAALI